MVLRMWIYSLIEYDQFGQGKVISSFVKPAADSTIKFDSFKKKQKIINQKTIKSFSKKKGPEKFQSPIQTEMEELW